MSRRQRKTVYWQDAPMPREQMVLIPATLEESIPAEHPVRMVDELLSRMDWSAWEARYHGSLGQPPIHPSVLCKILLFAMIRRIRSSRQIEYALKHSIDFMWLSSGRQIDHVTLCEFRRQYSKELRGIFRQLVKLAIDLGMANLSELCIDGTRVLASANKYKTWTAARLEKALAELDRQLADALSGLEEADRVNEDLLGDEYPADQLPAALADIETRRAKLEQHLETVRKMDAARAKYGTDATKNPAQLPKTDPDSRILPNKEGGYAANYTPMATVDSQGGFIVCADVMIGNVEHDQLAMIVDSVRSDYDADIERVLVDSAYTTGENLTEAEQRGIELVGPLAEVKCGDNPAERDDPTQPVAEAELDKLPLNPTTKRFDKSAFVYDEEQDVYHCPAGKPLEHRSTEHVDRGNKKVERRVYRSEHCADCALASRCRKNPEAKKGREVAHDLHEAARRRHRRRMQTAEAQVAYARRQHPGETPFAAIKATFDMRRFLLRGIEGVGQEWLWASTAFNLKKLFGKPAQLARYFADQPKTQIA
jgi:transposase